MPRGAPDWSVNAPIEEVYKTLDYGEIAARSGNLLGFDRKGNVVFVDDCSSGVSRWNKISSTGERVVGKYGSNIYGGYSIFIEDDGSNSTRPGIYTSLPILNRSATGLEIIGSFAYTETLVELLLQFDDGSSLTSFNIRINNKDGELYLFDNTLNWRKIGSFEVLPAGTMWTWNAKMIVNPVTGYYEKVKFNGLDFSVSNYKGPVHDTLYPYMTIIQISAGYALFDSYGGINLNGVIFTVNE